MRKLAALIALALAALLVAAACGGGGQPAATPTPTPTLLAVGKIAFASDRDGNLEVYVMNADGTGQTNLTNNPTDDGFPAWSPAP